VNRSTNEVLRSAAAPGTGDEPSRCIEYEHVERGIPQLDGVDDDANVGGLPISKCIAGSDLEGGTSQSQVALGGHA
jgi:hypothetical protein